MINCKKFIKSNLTVGENPMYNPLDNKVYYVDIRGKAFYVADLDGNVLKKIDLPQQIGCMAICEDGDLLLGLEDGVYLLDKKDNLTLAHQRITIKGRRFNDGKVGTDGAYYLGTTDNSGNGAFYQLKKGVLTELFGGVSCSNGIDWSLDNKCLYYVDSPLRKIEVFDFDSSKENPLSNRRDYCNLDSEIPKGSVPDGMCIDKNGQLWVAIWGGNQVVKVSNQKIVDKIEVEVKKPSSCAFVGEKLDKLLITSASFEENDENAGSLYVANVGSCGVEINLYKK